MAYSWYDKHDQTKNYRILMKTDCYKCKFRNSVPGSPHSNCSNPDHNMTGNEHGRCNGWFIYPWDFDPIWRTKECDNFESNQYLKKIMNIEKAAKECFQKQIEPDTTEFECFFHYTDERVFESGFIKGYELQQIIQQELLIATICEREKRDTQSAINEVVEWVDKRLNKQTLPAVDQVDSSQ